MSGKSKNSFEVINDEIHIYGENWSRVGLTTYRKDYYDEIQVRCRLTKQKFFYKRTKGHCRKIVVVVIDIISCKPKKIWYADFY